MQREPRAFLLDVIDSCEAIAQVIAELGLDDYKSKRVVRSGSAHNHGYKTVNDALVWAVAVRDAPALRVECEALLIELDSAGAD